VVHVPECAWIGEELVAKVRMGDTQALLWAIVTLAGAWLRGSGVHPEHYQAVSRTDIAGCKHEQHSPPPDAVQRAFWAAGCDLLDLLALSPEGQKTIQDF